MNMVPAHETIPAVIPPLRMTSLAPSGIDEAIRFCNFMSESTLLPKEYCGKPANIFLAVQWGMEVGLAPLQALQNIAVINGKPSIYGDAALALVRASKSFEFIREIIENEGDKAVAVCVIKRRGEPEHTVRFSMEDAKQAKLASKQGPWVEYPKRMLQMRARGFAIRDIFPDVMRGLITLEEARDIPTGDSGVPARPSDSAPNEPTAEPDEKPLMVPCPDRDGAMMYVAYCDEECSHRQGCPALPEEDNHTKPEGSVDIEVLRQAWRDATVKVGKAKVSAEVAIITGTATPNPEDLTVQTQHELLAALLLLAQGVAA